MAVTKRKRDFGSFRVPSLREGLGPTSSLETEAGNLIDEPPTEGLWPNRLTDRSITERTNARVHLSRRRTCGAVSSVCTHKENAMFSHAEEPYGFANRYLRRSALAVAIASIVVAANPATPLALADNPGAHQRPIEDFVDSQGTLCLDDACLDFGQGDECVLFVPPVENFLGWTDLPDCEGVAIDYAGLADEWITEESDGDVSFGTEFSGSITERVLADGRTQVSVRLHTTNALVWAFEDCNFDFAGAPTIFGHRAPDVLDGASAALGSSLLRVTYTTAAAPGDDLPDLLQILICPDNEEELVSIAFVATADGEFTEDSDFPDGTPAVLHTTQTGLFLSGFHGAVGDGFPAEFINIDPVDP